jgi:hypothetical protein
MTSDREDTVDEPQAVAKSKPRKQTKRCRSWRPGKTPHNPVHRPGKCRKCWRPCLAKISPETIATDHVDGCVAVRCDECTDELLLNHDAWVRRALASEEDASVRVLERLKDDGEGAVAYTAQWQMIHGKRSSEDLVAEVLEVAPTIITPVDQTIGESDDPFDDVGTWATANNTDSGWE